VDGAIAAAMDAGRQLKTLACDAGALLREAVKRNETILVEGAQGALLDLDHGTYPYVTSSSTLAGGFGPGTGLPPRALTRLIGVAKSYSTRVGEGPFVTEQNNETGARIRERGKEYGSTTGRPRRCGWFDAVAVRYACQLSGVDELVLTSLDVLGTFPKLSVCVAYEADGRRIEEFPAHLPHLDGVKPVYEELEGWTDDLRGCRDFDKLPQNARRYVERLEALTGVRIAKVSVGPERTEIIHRDRPA
jgi:adenylosuccinate synthase